MKIRFYAGLLCALWALSASPPSYVQWGALAVDLQTGEVVAEHRSERVFVPASVTKLWTAALALERLGPDHSFETEVVGRDGELVLVGGGDPLLDGVGVAELTRQLAMHGLGGLAVVDNSRFSGPPWGEDWAWDDLLYSWCPTVAATLVDGDPVVELQLGEEGGSPPDGVLARISSPTVAQLVRKMNKESDNLIAEVLWRHLGDGTAEGGRRAMANFAEFLGERMAGLVFMDGSGLSRRGMMSPAQVVGLLVHMAHNGAFVDSLPVGGVDGTLEHRFVGTSLEGRVRAKTGTMSGVGAMAGYVDSVAFAIFVNGGDERDEIRAFFDEWLVLTFPLLVDPYRP